MTHPPDDEPAIWLRQVPRDFPDAPGVWSQRLLPGYVTVAHSRERPSGDLLRQGSTEVPILI